MSWSVLKYPFTIGMMFTIFRIVVSFAKKSVPFLDDAIKGSKNQDLKRALDTTDIDKKVDSIYNTVDKGLSKIDEMKENSLNKKIANSNTKRKDFINAVDTKIQREKDKENEAMRELLGMDV